MKTAATMPNLGRKADCRFSHPDNKKRFMLEISRRNEFGIYISQEFPDNKSDLQVAYDGGFDSEYDYQEFCEAIYSLIKFCGGQVVPFEK